jgi:hypothetical protein
VTRPPATRAAVDDAEPVERADTVEHDGGATRTEAVGPAPARPWRSRLPYAVELLALLPLLLTVRRVMAAPLMSYQDYWETLHRITNPDGSPHLRGFFTYQNEHPFTVPSAVFYLTARFAGGDNRTLGYYVILVAAVTVLLLRWLLPRAWSPMARAWLTVMLSFVVFCPAGLWNFVRGMSGVAWLTANLFAVLAIAFATKRWTVLAVAAACIAVLSYGTGFGALLAIAVVAFVLRQARWRVFAPLALLVVTGAIWVATSHGGTSGGGVSHNPALLASTFLSNLGLLWAPTATETGALLGAAGLALLALAAGVVWRRRSPVAGAAADAAAADGAADGALDARAVDPRAEYDDVAPWWGLAVYAIAASGLIALGRSEAFGGDGVQSRYTSLPALFWIAVIIVTLRVLLAGQLLVGRVTAVAVTVLVFYAQSVPLSNQAVSEQPTQDLLATAVRLDAADSFGPRFLFPNEMVPRLKTLGDYPFDSRYSLGCGGLVPGDTVNAGSARPLAPTAARIDTDQLTVDSRMLRGWLLTTDPVRCVLLVDGAGKIVGGGAYGFARPDVAALRGRADQAVGWQAVAPSAQRDVHVLIGFDNGFRTIPPPAPTR